MGNTLDELFRHNNWANLKLLSVCEGLSSDILDSSIPGTYGSVLDTVLHVAGAQERYVQRLSGKEHEKPVRESSGFPGFEALRESFTWTGEALRALAVETEHEASIKTEFESASYEIQAPVVLVQVINHGTEHRAQIATTLSHHGVDPPVLDGWTYGDHAGLIKKL